MFDFKITGPRRVEWFRAVIYYGKKSGKRYEFPVEYAQDGEEIFILPGTPERKTWWRNLEGGATIGLIKRAQFLAGHAELLQGKRFERIIVDALKVYLRRFPASARQHKVSTLPDGSFSPADLNRVAQSIILVRVKFL